MPQIIWAAVCLLGLWQSVAFAADSHPLAFTIAIIQPYKADIDAFHNAVEGFISYLGEHLEHDFNTQIYDSPEQLYTTLQQNPTNSAQPPIDLILTVGPAATSAVAAKISDIPIVFTMVLEPETLLKNRQDVVGASLSIPAEINLKMIAEIFPAAKTVGILYDPKRNAAFVAKMTMLASAMNLEVLAFPVDSLKTLPDALHQVGNQADVLLGIVDNTIYTPQTAKFILEDTVKKRIPFIGASPAYVRAGALASLAFDPKDIGCQSAALAIKILSGISPVLLQSTIPEKLSYALNLRTAEIIGMKIPDAVMEKATIIYE